MSKSIFSHEFSLALITRDNNEIKEKNTTGLKQISAFQHNILDLTLSS